MDSFDITAGRDTIVARVSSAMLDGHPVRVVTRLTDINPPCAYVSLDTVDPHNFGATVRYNLFLVAPTTDEDVSIGQLQGLLEAVLPMVSPADLVTYVGLQVPEQSQPLPALKIPIEK